MIKRLIKNLVKKVLRLMPSDNYIMFESIPDLSDNTMPVFEEMVKRGIGKSYKMVWLIKDCKQNLPRYENTIYVDMGNIWNRIKYNYYICNSRAIIMCNRILEKGSKKQKEFYLCHGTAIKSVRHYYTLPDYIDYMLVASEGSKDMMAYEFMVDKEKVFALGFPRNDVMGYVKKDLSSLFEMKYKKIVVWYPTFRQHKSSEKLTNCQNALPILHNTEMAKKLNEIAEEKEVLLVIKPHFAQDVSYIKDYNLSNIVFIDDEFFVKNHITSYEFVASTDALITDYSSIYFDYLLCDKPVAVVWEDIEDYKKSPGFSIDVDEMMKCASKIYTLEDFEQFLKDVSCGNDKYRELRKEINVWANYSNDGENTKRVVDFIIEKAHL